LSSTKCSLCGAAVPLHSQCRDRFDLCMALEFKNFAAFGAVHHLTVPCYMLQHNAYSRIAWLEARKMIARFIREGITPAVIRKENRLMVDGGHRTWSINKVEKLSEFDAIIWSRSLADVRTDDPGTYCSDVRLWAGSILEDTESLILKLDALEYQRS
jgi:hypothetical protein